VGAQRVVRRQLGGYLVRQRGAQPTLPVDGRQLFQLAVRVFVQLALFHRQVGQLGIGLRLHRNILASRHRHRTGHGPGDAGGQDGRRRGTTGRDADHQPGHRDDAVIGAKHGGTQPADAVGAMDFRMSGSTHWISLGGRDGPRRNDSQPRRGRRSVKPMPVGC